MRGILRMMMLVVIVIMCVEDHHMLSNLVFLRSSFKDALWKQVHDFFVKANLIVFDLFPERERSN